jgi:hypothetical protein
MINIKKNSTRITLSTDEVKEKKALKKSCFVEVGTNFSKTVSQLSFY